MLMLDAAASDLAVVVDTKSGPNPDSNFGKGKSGVENHDVTTTPDSKYAILALRYVDAAGQMKTSGVQLYDIAAKKFIGGISNTCGLCCMSCPRYEHGTTDLRRHWKIPIVFTNTFLNLQGERSNRSPCFIRDAVSFMTNAMMQERRGCYSSHD